MSVSNRAATGQPAKNALAAAMHTICSAIYGSRGATHIASDARRIVDELEDLGYIIIARPYTKPARRGKDIAKAIAEHDPWIGKSHSARLCGG